MMSILVFIISLYIPSSPGAFLSFVVETAILSRLMLINSLHLLWSSFLLYHLVFRSLIGASGSFPSSSFANCSRVSFGVVV